MTRTESGGDGELSPLAAALYRLLVARVRGGALSVTYGELAAELPESLATHQRSSRLHEALGEVSGACLARRLPCLPAIVWRADRHRPGPAYFRFAHPGLRAEATRQAAWEQEHARVIAAAKRYPTKLA